jgi:ATP-dependent RNA helicase DDX46/PRP5
MPFRKVFYIESKEIKNLNDDDIRVLRKKMGNVRVRGSNCPRPVLNWFQCGISDKILDLLEARNYTEPFPIQAQALPVIMSGRDAIGIAETGSGKTVAYILPMIRHILDQRPIEDGEGPIALVLAPIRELASQIFKEIKIFSQAVKLRCVCVYGGTGVSGQLSELKRGCETVVCTPGRMIDVLTTSNGKITNLKRVLHLLGYVCSHR